MTDAKQKAEAQAIVAMAALGPLIHSDVQQNNPTSDQQSSRIY